MATSGDPQTAIAARGIILVMTAPDLEALPGMVRATYQVMTQRPAVEHVDEAWQAVLAPPLPADLYALAYAWAHHAGVRTRWDVFDRWDLQIAIAPVTPDEVRAACAALAASSARTELPDGPLFRLGVDAGGTEYFVGVTNGQSVVFGPERGEDYGSIEDMFQTLYERNDCRRDAALDPFLPADFFGDAGELDDDGRID